MRRLCNAQSKRAKACRLWLGKDCLDGIGAITAAKATHKQPESGAHWQDILQCQDPYPSLGDIAMTSGSETVDRLNRSPSAHEEALPSADAVAEVCAIASQRPVAPVAANKTRVAVLMSGGVDSSATALLMQKAGYDVVGVTGWLIKSGSRCCDTGMIDAARVCEQLGIDHHAVDLRELFKTQIMDQFPASYAKAKTPLPCSMCNTLIKWGALLNYGKKLLNATYIATGHYARVIETDKGTRLARAVDPSKDQSYVLWGISMEQLRSTLLPLGEFSKTDIRKIAAEANLVSANKPDSQDLCFIPKGQTTQEYLSNFLVAAPGPIIHAVSGKLMGEHQGTHNYTIGQRRGLGIASPDPLYVTSLDPDLHVVYVGPQSALLRQELTASAANWLMDEPPTEPFDALAKIRYNSAAVPARVIPLPEGQISVQFNEPQPAITPGQVLGIYDETNTYVLGGGWID